ncbi:hypothetical protein [Stenotrophomonas geniculata]|uniref:hypothetical protein n=1 Tax=Stenotrophomonas geniculata TaxID=86188 RepID=UPI003B0271B3
MLSAPQDLNQGTPTSPELPLAEGLIAITGTLDNDGGSISNGGTVSLAARNGLDNSGGRLGVSALQAGKAASSWTVQSLFNNDGGLWPPMPCSWRCGQVGNAGGRIEHAGRGAAAGYG